jgi:1-acyl-sn-glycerol-3-phosphate acyltransferase
MPGALLIVFLSAIAILVYVSQKAVVIDWESKYANWLDGLVRLLCRHVHHLPPTTIQLPDDGPAIVVANHVSGLDPFLLIAASKRPLRFLIAREEYEKPVLNWLFRMAGCIPVDRSGKPEKALRQALRALNEGEVVAIFPHGKIHLDSDPSRKLKAGFAYLASRTQAQIFPVRIDGVAAEGSVAAAPFIPGQVQLTMAQALSCEINTIHECINKVSTFIERPQNSSL